MKQRILLLAPASPGMRVTPVRLILTCGARPPAKHPTGAFLGRSTAPGLLSPSRMH